MARVYTSPYRDVVRAKIVLYAVRGLRNDEIAARLDTPRQIVSKWRKRFFEEGLAGFEERPRLRTEGGPRPRPLRRSLARQTFGRPGLRALDRREDEHPGSKAYPPHGAARAGPADARRTRDRAHGRVGVLRGVGRPSRETPWTLRA
jgi:transposase-like protein